MKTTIHTPATTRVRPVTYGRNPQLRTPDARRTKFLHYNLRGNPPAVPAVHSFSITADQLIAIIADDIATSGKPVAEYWLGFAELRELVDVRITSTGGWSSPFITGWSSPFLTGGTLDAIPVDVRPAIVDRARAILLAHVPLLLESDVPASPDTVTSDVATIGTAHPGDVSDARAAYRAAYVATIGTADLDTGAADPITDELTDAADADAFPHDVAPVTPRTKQQLADALRAVPGRDELPELSDRSLKRANLTELNAMAELFGV